MSSYASYNRKKEPKQQGYGSYVCTSCEPSVRFPTHDALMKHKAEKRAKSPQDHIHCKFCGDDFITIDAERFHIQQHHPNPQSLTCPACGQGPFIRVAALAQHIERNECSKLSMSQIQAVRDKKAEFAQRLIAQTNAPLKNHFTDFMPTSRKLNTEELYGGWGDLEGSVKSEYGETSWGATDEDSVNGAFTNTFEDDFPELDGKSPGMEGVSPGIEALAGSSLAVSQSDDGDSQATSSWLAPHLRGPKPSAPTSAAGSPSTFNAEKSSSDWVPPHLRGSKKSVSKKSPVGVGVIEVKGKGKENVASAWAPPHLRGPKQNAPASTTPMVDPSHFSKPNEGPVSPNAAWTTPKALFADAPPAQKPTQQQLQAATSYNPNVEAWLDFDHPDHPDFNHGRYWCPYSNAFMCPKVRCGKAFKKAGGLVSHLRGSAHGGKKYTCPNCHKDFSSLQSVTAHSESASQRCHIRYTEGYNAYMDQLTSGIVDIAFNAHEDGTHKYETSVAAIKTWGDEKTAKRVEMERLAEKQQEAGKEGQDRQAAKAVKMEDEGRHRQREMW